MTDKKISDLLPIFCPVCAHVDLVTDLEHFVEYLRMQWDYTFRQMSEGKEKQDMMEKVSRQNNPKRLKEIIDKDGYIVGLCRNCITDWSEKYMTEKGIKTVRIGNMLFDPKFLEENYDKIKEKLKI